MKKINDFERDNKTSVNWKQIYDKINNNNTKVTWGIIFQNSTKFCSISTKLKMHILKAIVPGIYPIIIYLYWSWEELWYRWTKHTLLCNHSQFCHKKWTYNYFILTLNNYWSYLLCELFYFNLSKLFKNNLKKI